MKTERTRDLQAQRVDRTKAENTIYVKQGVRPKKAREGQHLYDGKFYLVRQQGKWVRIGVTEAEAEAEISEAIANAPRATQIENINVSQVVAGAEQTEYKQYIQGNPPGQTFFFEAYDSLADRTAGTELPTDEQPTNVSFFPATPAQTAGTHTVTITYTPSTNRTAVVFVEVYIE